MMKPMNILILLSLLTGLRGQEIPSQPQAEKNGIYSWTGEGMPEALPNLVQIAVNTRFFLKLEPSIEFSKKQRDRLEQIYFRHEAELIQRSAEFRLADSRLNALLAQSKINMREVEEVVQDKEKIRSRVDLIRIRNALEAIKLLSHKQHIKVLLVVRDIVSRVPGSSRR